MAVSCSHGHLLDKTASDAVLKFKDIYKPHSRIHLGDYTDIPAFRSGAKGTSDEAVSLKSDIKEGCRFIKDFNPTVLFNGNHDWRLWKNSEHWNQIRAEGASMLINKIREAVPKKAIFIEDYNSRKSIYKLGDTSFMHGWMYNENAIRDHAEHFGRCVIGHLHTVGQMQGRRVDNPTCYCVGLLGDPDLFDYAKAQRSYAKWSQGFAWGEYCDDECIVNLCARNKGDEWRLPL